MKKYYLVWMAITVFFLNDHNGFAQNLIDTTPLRNTTNIPANTNIVLTFDTTTDANTLNASTILVSGSQTGLIAGVFSGQGTPVVTFIPNATFKPGEVITVVVTNNLTLGNVALANPTVFYFTIISNSVAAPLGFLKREISTLENYATDLYTADIDNDGDLDVVTAASIINTIAWYENDGTDQPTFTRHVVTNTADFATAVFVGDLDNDGDLDILSASAEDDTIAWYENDGATTPSFTKIVVSNTADFATSVTVGDMDGDGDLDILSASLFDDVVAWYENDGAADPTFTRIVITTATNGAYTLTIGDMEGDGDLDIFSTSRYDDTISWFENDGGIDPTFTECIISTSVNNATDISFGDLDGDGDYDIAASSRDDDSIFWFENNGGSNPTFTKIVLTNTADGARRVSIDDIDGDGDLDIFAVSNYDDTVSWFENDGAIAPSFTEQIITKTADGANSISVGDVDGDGDLDIFVASTNDDTVAWYEATTELQITTSSPVAQSTSVPVDSPIIINFTTTLDATTINLNSILITGAQTGIIEGAFTGGGTSTLVFNPLNSFKPGELITVVLTTNLSSEEGYFLRNPSMFSFVVETASMPSPVSYMDHTVTTALDYVTKISLADIDNDGDLDIVSSSVNDDTIAWFENNGDPVNPIFTKNTITITANSATSVVVADLDNDGDLDVVSSSSQDDTVAWYENDGNADPMFTKIIITTTADWAYRLAVGDLDNDGDLDIISGSQSDQTLAWFENDGASDPSFSQNIISTTVSGIHDIAVGDLDNDGDLDMLVALRYSNTVSWYENNGAPNPTFINNIITTNAMTVKAVSLGDLDNDGDLDVLSTSTADNTIAWYENDGATNPTFTKTVISSTVSDLLTVNVGDVDGDGDLDVLVANVNTFDYYENDGASNPIFTKVLITSNSNSASSITTGDMDYDGDLDIVVGKFSDRISWYEAFDPTLSTANLSLEEHFAIYPNPVKDKLTIQSNSDNSIQSIAIYDLSGRLVQKNILENNTMTSYVLDMSTLNTGTYLLQLYSTEGTILKKISKE
ncbi:T9SS type A sorting domain-containing protein [Flavobacterium jejuense]|uniref:T9SS type A sorting domain-containing protein n=1 Tax=Flavobacterium jejuense TaxID=1544455 RepID=A0ABX0IR67_9FLAO|nr:FG-GAP-like repeat-containing protein [Flavobacterium jejuense]NHN24973.1 T9SS type A sorting domain-containing protein [Flavobacterium jejuense]